MSERQLRINVNVITSGSHPGAWRAPEGHRFGFVDVDHYQQAARIAERGLLDAVFLADQVSMAPDIGSGPGWGIMDPVVTVGAMAAVTQWIGFIATASTTFNHPYNIARTFASLDHVTRGRIGLNLVTTMADEAASNFGLSILPVRDDRYTRAAEFADVAIALWDSWEDLALVADQTTGIFADMSRIHKINHVGPNFSVAGPLQVPRSPQGRPLLVQAGGSHQGRDLAARYADAIFSASHLIDEGRTYYADIKERARRFGRDPDSIAVLPGLSLIIGGTEAEAKARKKELDELAGLSDQRLLRLFANRVGLEPEEIEIDRPFPAEHLNRLSLHPRSHGFADAILALAKDRTMTVRELIDHGVGHRRVVGSPEQVADTMEEWFKGRAADGFNIMCDIFPSGLEAFVDHVIPILQRRGLSRREYSGKTLRDHYGLPRPASIYETPLTKGVDHLHRAAS
ncbi:LLM class flavin-dependent oxidoreductase [Beijerinckia indica]|uniref:Nitrilotriacetate monooxygenase component A n=1 Tax=Beijerinckia indica subsp. indica (strain ATCC 9039 / DSM 1715 / NCIMB 8712) TaxID=395963 RepID=B2IIU6_BEII9|nr:LLM class flavin-dependent oxidoreductase [Beijerinckia indica]ACB96158.1 nitrilotriacetate monooxygenase component A [Beijerinckia indica subsp. indica ATCC 9039]